MDSLFTSSPCPNPTDLGDYVMMESCIDHGCVLSDNSCSESYSEHVRPRTKQCQRWRNLKKKEFPPPLTVLAMTENHRPHMPFVMRRFTTDDGRLVIVEERARHHDYFRVTRSEGRLVLDLVAVEEREGDGVEERESEVGNNLRNVMMINSKKCDDMAERECNDVAERESGDLAERGSSYYNNVAVTNDRGGDDMEEREHDDMEEREGTEGNECCNVAIRSVGKCYDYMRVRSSPCLFTMTMPTVRPVHI